MLRVEGAGVPLPHQLLHHREHVHLALVGEDLGVLDGRPPHPDVAVVDVVDAVALPEPAADRDRVLAQLAGHPAVVGDAVGRAVDDADEPLPALEGGHDLPGPTAQGDGRVARVERQPDARILGRRHHGLQEIGDVRPHLVEGVRADVRQRGQVLGPVVVVGGHSRPAAPGLLVVPLGQPVSVEVVLDHGHAGAARRPDRRLHLVDLLVAARPAVECLRKAADHQVGNGEASLPEALHQRAEVGLGPRNARAPHEHVVDPDLLDPTHLLLVHVRAGAQAELRSPAGFGGRPVAGKGPRERGGEGECPRGVDEAPTGQPGAHGFFSAG